MSADDSGPEAAHVAPEPADLTPRSADVAPQSAEVAPQSGSGDADDRQLKRSWRWRRRLVRVRRVLKGGFGVILLLVVVAVALASQTGRGQDIVLRAVLDRVRGSLAGELTVAGVRSGTLLTGATLTDVRLTASDGRPFLVADSVVLRYSLLSSVFGGSPIRSTTLWGADIEISQYTPDQTMNLDLLLASGADTTGQGGEGGEGDAARALRLGHIAIREGSARVLTPAGAASRARTVMGPDGARLRELAFEDLALDVENVAIAPGAAIAFDARLASFAASIYIVPDPLVIQQVFGRATFGDEGLRIDEAAFRVPGSLLRGSLVFGPLAEGDAWTLRSALTTDGWGDLADLSWIDERIPRGRFRGGAGLVVRDGIRLDLDDFEVELEASHLIFDGRATFAADLFLDQLEIAANPVTLDRLEPWVGAEFPLDGWLSGRAVFTGRLSDVYGEGRVTLVPTGFSGRPVTAAFSGMIHRGADPGATEFEARLDPLNYEMLSALWPDLPWEGTGSGTVRLDGRRSEGFDIRADLEHRSDGGVVSGFGVEGRLGADERDDWIAGLDVELRPLSLSLIAELAPDLALRGSASGPLRIEGPVGDLRFEGELLTSGGAVELGGRVDLRDLASNYRLALAADSLAPATLSARLPERTVWSGNMSVEGSGLRLDSANLTATLAIRDSRVGDTRVDSIIGQVRLDDGVMITDSLRANIAGITLSARGRLGLSPERYGAMGIDFEAPTVVGLRPLLMGVPDSVLVRDDLTELDREFLRLQGIEPDTLPSEVEVRLAGAVRGSASLSGHIGGFDAGVLLDIEGGRYRADQVDSARVALSAEGLPARDGLWQIGANAHGIVWDGRSFQRGGFEADMISRAGTGRVEILRRAGELYRASGAFAGDASEGRVDLEEWSLQVGPRVWVLTTPGRVTWNETTITVDSLDITRADSDPMHLVVDGTLTRNGESDFRILVDGLHAEQVLHVAQLDDVDVEGHVEVDLTVRGSSLSPTIDGTFQVFGPKYGAMQLTELVGSLRYANRLASVDVEGRDGVRPVLTASGSIPVDLALEDVTDRLLDEPMDVTLRADSLDAAIALSYLSSLQGVVGWISGEVRVRGTSREPEPEGTVRISDAGWSVEAIGVRHSGIDGELRLRSDRTVDVALSTRASGVSEVSGTILLEPVRNPALDLRFAFSRFLGVSRPDIESTVSGTIDLGGTYRRPVARGALTVDEGAIFVDELQRAAGVVDLSDPFLFDVGLAVDTTALVTQPLFAGLRNPFFDNLRVDVDLSVPRGSWLRSIDTNVEMTGDLLVRYDRFAGDFVLIGELEAVRGTHRVLGRTFDLDEGTISFIGRPGLNPDLDIQASTRIRSPDNPPLGVNAQVTGTLVQPVVTLSTDQAGLAEEDLVSYLIFGQSSGALALGAGRGGSQQSVVQGGLVTFIGGGLATQIGSVIAQELPLLDYFSIQQANGVSTLDESYLRETQLEVGRYFGDDIFVIVVLRPFDRGPVNQNPVPGVRVEWALTDDYNVEGFLEDRFLRSGSSSLATSSGLIDNDRIWGVFLFREWGYSPNRDPREY